MQVTLYYLTSNQLSNYFFIQDWILSLPDYRKIIEKYNVIISI